MFVGSQEASCSRKGRSREIIVKAGQPPSEAESPVPVFYIDGHRKVAYADHLIPRGLIGRLEKVLGCRALVVRKKNKAHQ